jgi:excisionase family DNA binding protein
MQYAFQILVAKGAHEMKKQTTEKPVFNNVDDLANELGLSRAVVYREIRAGRIPHLRLGRRIVLPRSAIAAWLHDGGLRRVASNLE